MSEVNAATGDRGQGRLRRVGHKGADLIVPGNTHASFDAALEAGVLLAHDHEDAASRAPHTLEEGLDYLAAPPFDGVELDLDLKLPGYERRVMQALRERELLERSLISTQFRSSLAAIRAAEPAVRIGWSVPKVKQDPFRSPLTIPAAVVVLQAARAVLPSRAHEAIRSGRCDAIMAHWRLVTARLVSRVQDAGGELYVWTVDELSRLSELEALGVTGVITGDPRLFGALAA